MVNSMSHLFDHVNTYQSKINALFANLDIAELDRVIKRIILAFKEGNSIYIAGNGGSAATASHIHEDFVFYSRHFTEKRLKVVSLTNNIPFITAVANDVGYEDIFVEQMRSNFNKGDILIVISASGNSKNVIRAVEYANKIGGTSIAFVGFNGGQLKNISDICLFTSNPKGDYGPIEDMHLILGHLIISYFSVNNNFMKLSC